MITRAVVLSLLLASQASADTRFEGDLELTPPGCQSVGKCILKNKLKFTDSNQIEWVADAGLPTDGASIPGIFQSIVGKPFDPKFIKPAIIHDHYCERHVRPWRQTHRVFYEGLLDQGVDSAKAKTMYFAVFLGGPKWIELIAGKNCSPTGRCVNFKSFAKLSTLEKNNKSDKPKTVLFRNADYSAPDFQKAIVAVQQELEANPDALSVDQLEEKALKLRPNDFYFKHQDKIQIKDDLILE